MWSAREKTDGQRHFTTRNLSILPALADCCEGFPEATALSHLRKAIQTGGSNYGVFLRETQPGSY